MNNDFEILENIELNGKTHIIHFTDIYEKYNRTISAIFEIYKMYLQHFMEKNFKCEIIEEKTNHHYCAENIYDNELDHIIGYYFVFENENEMNKCIDILNSIRISFELIEN